MQITRVWLMLTDRCNLNCDFCYQKTKGTEDSCEKTLDKAIEFINKNSVENAEIMLWGGEPLLRFDLIKYMVEKYPHLNLRFATNGHLLTPEIVEFLRKHRDTLGVCLSIEAGSTPPETYGLHKACKSFVHLIGTKVDKIYSSVESLYNIGFREFQVGLAHLQEYTDEDMERYAIELRKLLGWFRADFWNENDRLIILNWEDMLRNHFENKAKRLSFCGAGLSAIAITPTGDIYPCDWFYTLKKYKMGDVDSGLNDTKMLFEYINKNRNKLFGMCKECEINNVCGSHVCLTENYVVNGSIYRPVDTTCKAIKMERKIVIEEGSKEPILKRSKEDVCQPIRTLN